MVIFNSYVSLPEGIEPYWTSIMALTVVQTDHESAGGWNVEASCKARGAKGRSKEERPSEWVNPLDSPLVNIQKNYRKSPCSMGKSTISITIFNSYVSHYQRIPMDPRTCSLYCHGPTFLERRVQVGPTKLDDGPMTYQAQDHPSSCASQECRAWG